MHILNISLVTRKK